MKKAGIGIIGYGGFGRFLHMNWNKMETAEVIAIADINPENRPSDKTSFTTEWKELLVNEDIDIISIVTPPATHAEIACAAMEAGKHVLVEKPLSIALEDALKIKETRDKTGKIAAVNYMLRFNPLVEKLKEYSQENIFGILRHASVENFAQDEELPIDHWFWDRDVAGGILIEHAVHFIDLVDSLTATRIRNVSGGRQLRNEQQEDQILATVTYENNLVATHYHEFSGLKQFEITNVRLGFELARFRLNGWIPINGKVEALVDEQKLHNLQSLPGWKEISREEVINASGDKTNVVITAGNQHQADIIVRGEFALPDNKLEVYGQCLRDMMQDIINVINGKKLAVKADIEAGIKTLDIAIQATKDARNE